jgi:hypothetical protein
MSGNVSTVCRGFRANQTFDEHVAAVTALINIDDPDQQHNLLIYATAKSCPKLIRRFQHRIHSRPYLDRIQEINRLQTTGRDFPPAQPITSRKGQRDAAFLAAISHPQNQLVFGLSGLSISHLLNIAKRYDKAPAGSPLPQIYTQDTCMEFMRLLKHILKEYEKALRTVAQFKGRAIEAKEIAEFRNGIYALTTSGLTLHAIVYTSFFDEHLQRLRVHHHAPLAVIPAAIPTLAAEAAPPASTPDDPDSDFDFFDTDLNLIDLDNLPLDLDFLSDTDMGTDTDTDTEAEFPLALADPGVWRTYGKRLRGLVSNFEAANNLIKHPFKSGGQRLSLQVEVLAFSQPDKSIGDWKDLFRAIVSPPNNPPPYNVETAITRILQLLPAESRRIIKFWGSQHCEASLAVMAVTHNLPV